MLKLLVMSTISLFDYIRTTTKSGVVGVTQPQASLKRPYCEAVRCKRVLEWILLRKIIPGMCCMVHEEWGDLYHVMGLHVWTSRNGELQVFVRAIAGMHIVLWLAIVLSGVCATTSLCHGYVGSGLLKCRLSFSSLDSGDTELQKYGSCYFSFGMKIRRYLGSLFTCEGLFF